MKRNIEKTWLYIFLLLFSAYFAPTLLRAQTYEQLDAEAKQAAEDFRKKNYQQSVYEGWVEELNAENYEKAIAGVNKYLAYMPDEPEFLSVRANAYAKLFNREIPAASADFPYLYLKKLKESSNFRSARADFIQAIKLEPQNKRFHDFFGRFLSDAGLPTEALRQFNHALAIDPKYFRAVRGKAEVIYFTGDFQGCIETVNNFMRHPEYQKYDDKFSYFQLGECYASLGDKINAAQNFDKAIALQPGLKNSWLYLAFLKDGYLCRRINRKISENPVEAFVDQMQEGRCNTSNGLFFLERLAGIEGRDENLKKYAMMHLATVLKQRDNAPPADSLTEEERKSFADYYLKEARKFRDESKYTEAMAAINRTLALDPNNVDALVLRANTLLDYGSNDVRMLAWRDQMPLSRIPTAEYEARMIRSEVYGRIKGNHVAAVNEYDKAVAVKSKSYQEYFKRGAYPGEKRNEEADAAYDALLRAFVISLKSEDLSLVLIRSLAGKYPHLAECYRQESAVHETLNNKFEQLKKEYNLEVTDFNKRFNEIRDKTRQGTLSQANGFSQTMSVIDEMLAMMERYIARYDQLVVQSAVGGGEIIRELTKRSQISIRREIIQKRAERLEFENALKKL